MKYYLFEHCQDDCNADTKDLSLLSFGACSKQYLMRLSNFFIVIYCTIISVAVLYEQQALLPELSSQWGISADAAALLTTVTMIPLAIAPLVYGYVLEHVSSRNLLTTGLGVLTVLQLALAQNPGYIPFLLLRAFQGLMLPAILTALMTYSSTMNGTKGVRRAISLYIAATIVGGFCGRTFSGVIANYYDWQTAFWLWFMLAAIALPLTRKLAFDPRANIGQLRWHEIRTLISRPVNRLGLASVFSMFFIFAAMMNFLPFHMRQLDPAITQSSIAWVYAGYLVGVIVPLSSLWMVRVFGGEKRTLLIGCAIYTGGLGMLTTGNLPLIYMGMFIFAAGMFTLHSVLSACLNEMEVRRKGLINGLYVSVYYSGGAIGSYLPGVIYTRFGWLSYSACLFGMLIILWVLIWNMPILTNKTFQNGG
ncbi:MFS transporter [Acidihalobacter prosperus]